MQLDDDATDLARVSPTRAEPAGSPSEAELIRLAAANRLLRDELARLTDETRIGLESASLQAARNERLLEWAARNEAVLQGLYASTFWQITAPLRLLARLIGGAPPGVAAPSRMGRARALAAEAGWGIVLRKGIAFGRHQARAVRQRIGARLARRQVAEASRIDLAYAAPLSTSGAALFAPRVLIIAELSVPQCAKYRVWQKREFIERLGVACMVHDWHDTVAARSALQVCSLVVFYRVPGTPEVLELIAEARRLKLTSYWEVDDLIFDEQLYRANRNLDALAPELVENLLDGVRLYRRAMLACDTAIASTASLAEAMRDAGVADPMVVENALDAETLEIAEALRAGRSAADPRQVRLVYGSGTKTHDVDFADVAPAIASLMEQRPQVRLRIVGELTLPPELAAFADRIEREDRKDYGTWLRLLSEGDIALAPLEATRFNDAKSNIKFLEAAILGMPCVCSPRAEFRSVVTTGENGMLAESAADWLSVLRELVDKPELRRRMGEAARRSALARYAPDAIARAQVAPLVAKLAQVRAPTLHVLVVNIFFWPRSFGGATIVAEETARRLGARDGIAVGVFTSHSRATVRDEGLRRYEQDGMPIISVGVPGHPDAIGEFDNPGIAERFAKVLRALRPDVVHVHSIQGLGSSILDKCAEQRVPYVVTVHDAWWICPRQFMVRGDGQYCFQTRIDLNLCRACVPQAFYLQERLDLLLRRLHGAAAVLSPSEAHRALYLANGLPAEQVRVLANGIRMPARPRRRRAGRTLRFGFVGGGEPIKGFIILRRAFEALSQANWKLLLIDNTWNLGFASLNCGDWQITGEISVAPAYSQDTMDEFFESIDVLLFPSQWKESFGLTVREALARDVWVIATDCGGPAEAIEDGVNGNLIPMDGEHRPMRDAIAALLDAPERLAGYRNPRKDALITFDQQTDALVEVLSTVVEAHGG